MHKLHLLRYSNIPETTYNHQNNLDIVHLTIPVFLLWSFFFRRLYLQVLLQLLIGLELYDDGNLNDYLNICFSKKVEDFAVQKEAYEIIKGTNYTIEMKKRLFEYMSRENLEKIKIIATLEFGNTSESSFNNKGGLLNEIRSVDLEILKLLQENKDFCKELHSYDITGIKPENLSAKKEILEFIKTQNTMSIREQITFFNQRFINRRTTNNIKSFWFG